jgi:HlyD family secretion protein
MIYLNSIQTGSVSPAVTNAQTALDQAKATDDQARNEVQQAQASVDLINAQISKLTVYSPTNGVVLTRSVEAGEFVQAGMTALTIGKLDTLKVTVYIPETQYGQIHLGQQANLSVDSYPNETFSAKVTRIANQAEYTPQNVQTKEGRQTTVYAIELTVENADGKLKPGMPTDVTFATKMASR